MTPTELAALTTEQKRIQVAEACGWKWIATPAQPTTGYWQRGQQGVEGYERTRWVNNEEAHEGTADYLNDLNAMAEAQQFVKDNDEYWAILLKIAEAEENLNWRTMTNLDGIRIAGTATAAHRADAFLLTVP